MAQKFAVFDIDGTIFRYQLYQAMVDVLVQNGDLPKEIEEASEEELKNWQNRTHEESFNDFAMARVRVFDKHIANVDPKKVEAAAHKVIEERAGHTYVYTRDLLERLRSEGYFLIAISGSMIEVSKPFADKYQFDDIEATEYHREDDKYTGDFTLRAHDKHKTIEEMMKKHNLTLEGSIAIGDSMGDATMLELVENPIAFNPEKRLFKLAREKGWKIVVERKNSIYELESKDGSYFLA